MKSWIVLLVAVAFVGCGDSKKSGVDLNNPTAKALTEHKWCGFDKSSTGDVVYDEDGNVVSKLEDAEISGISTYEFNKNGKLRMTSYDSRQGGPEVMEMNWAVAGDVLKVSGKTEEGPFTGELKIKDLKEGSFQLLDLEGEPYELKACDDENLAEVFYR